MRGKRKWLLLVVIIVIAVTVWALPTGYLTADKPEECANEGGAGSVPLKSGHVGASWDSFGQEDCEGLEPGQTLWHLVLSPVDKNASATINGVAGTNHGGSVHWDIVNTSSTADNWVAEVSSGLNYNPAQDCDLKSELRVSSASHCENGGDDNGDGDGGDDNGDGDGDGNDDIKELAFTGSSIWNYLIGFVLILGGGITSIALWKKTRRN